MVVVDVEVVEVEVVEVEVVEVEVVVEVEAGVVDQAVICSDGSLLCGDRRRVHKGYLFWRRCNAIHFQIQATADVFQTVQFGRRRLHPWCVANTH